MPSSEAAMQDRQWCMRLALDEAEAAYRLGEVPVGAVIVDAKGEVIAKSHNLKESVHNPCGHAELLAIQSAAQKIQGWRLEGCTLYVTLEPCPMCLAGLVQARVAQVVFGAYDAKGGALSLGYNLHRDQRLNHRFSMMGGVLHYECSRLLSQFFKERRPTS